MSNTPLRPKERAFFKDVIVPDPTVPAGTNNTLPSITFSATVKATVSPSWLVLEETASFKVTLKTWLPANVPTWLVSVTLLPYTFVFKEMIRFCKEPLPIRPLTLRSIFSTRSTREPALMLF